MKKENNKIKLFVVEDDPMYQRMVKYILELNPDHEVVVMSSGTECLERLDENPLAITLDYSLPDLPGNTVLSKIKEYNPDIDVIILSGQNDIHTAITLLKEGAYDYIPKDGETKERLLAALTNLKKQHELKQKVATLTHEVNSLKQELNRSHSFKKSIIGNSSAMQKVFAMLEKSIKTNITVSIKGETGTGKEVIAQAIHKNSPQKDAPFVAVNMSAIPKELLESELFGHEKGSFTGANQQKKGRFELADGGTLFLDEIAEMDISLQAKVLRVIQEREIVRVGGQKPIKFNARILVATHRDLLEEVQLGNFREDLYYRLLGLPINLPPLRERGNDIIILADYFIDLFAKLNDMKKKVLSKEAKQRLLSYSYPGNVRELKAIIELAVVLSESDVIEPDDLQFNSNKKETSFLATECSLEEYKKNIINHFLEKYDNDILLVANKLDIGKSTIYRMLKNSKPVR